MSKSDKTTAQNSITTSRNQSNTNFNQGMQESTSNNSGYQDLANQQGNSLNSAYGNLAATGGWNNPYYSAGGTAPGQGSAPASGSGSFADKVNALYSKYGKSDTGAGSGITDANYWSTTALNNAGGDQNYVLGRLESDLQGNGPDAGGGGPSSSGSYSAAGSPSYVNTFQRMQSPQGAFDPTRSAAVSSAADNLYDTSGNYGDVNQAIGQLLGASNNYGATNTSIGDLQKFAATGGLDSTQLGRIFNPTLQEMSATGGYTPEDIANMRASSNSSIASTYGNMADQLAQARAASGQLGPGVSNQGFKLLRSGAQAIGQNTQQTEANIKQAINQNRLAAGTTLGNLGEQTAGLQSNNTLSGYGTAGNLDISKNQAIQSAEAQAAQAGLSRQAQIDAAKEAAANIDLSRQGLINQTNLSAAGGEEQDALTRAGLDLSKYGIDTNAALQRYGINTNADLTRTGMANQATEAGLAGQGGVYNTNNANYNNAANLLYNYRSGSANNNAMLNNQQIQTGYMPGLGSDISSFLGNLSGITGGITGGLSGLSRYLPTGGSSSTLPNPGNPYVYGGGYLPTGQLVTS